MNSDRIESLYPQSPMQQGMLFHALHEPQTSVYFEQFACTLEGPLDIESLRQACQQVLDRHPALRTAFVWEDVEAPAQAVFRELELPWRVLDWRSVPVEEQAERLEAFLQADREQGFDLATPPLMRMTLVRLADERQRLIWSHHHMLLDGWSLPLVLREIFAGYEGLRAGQPVPAAPVRPYKEYIDWLQQQDLAAAEAFWRQYLAGFSRPTPLTELFGRRQNGVIVQYAQRQFILSPKVTGDLQALARQQHLTLNTLAQGAWAVLLSRYSGERDVVFGVTVSGRPPELDGVEDIVGLFINTLPLRAQLEPTAELCAWLQSLQARQTEARQYEYSPLAQVQTWSEVARGVSLFESLFVFENYPLDAVSEQAHFSLAVRDASTSEQTNYPLTVIFYPRTLPRLGDTLVVEFNYDAGQFTAEAMDRMAGHLRMVLEGMAQGAEGRLGDLPLLTPEELRQFEAWNATARAFAGPERLHELFEQQAARTPEAPAVVEAEDWGDVYATLEGSGGPVEAWERLQHCRLRRNPYVHCFSRQMVEQVITEDPAGLLLVKTQRDDIVLVNAAVWALLAHFDGERSLATLWEGLRAQPHEFVVARHIMNIARGESMWQASGLDAGATTSGFRRQEFRVEDKVEPWLRLVQALYQAHLVEMEGFDEAAPGMASSSAASSSAATSSAALDMASFADFAPAAASEPLPPLQAAPRAPVLLLGANTGMASMGLLYLAAYLRRHGVAAYCQLNDIWDTSESLEAHIADLLARVQPRLVGVSLKWFPHIARALEICRLVKKHAPEVETVLGGDTASYFYQELIQQEAVDYIVRGDGEAPLLGLALGESDVPNLVWKAEGQVQVAPFDYVHTADTSADVYLSHLAEVQVTPGELFYAPYAFIYTGQGCSMSCLYCAGARENQRRVFNRPMPYLRPVEVVRRDIEQVLPHTALLMFDFDLPNYGGLEYYQELWDGLDLRAHFGHFYFWRVPSAEFINLLAQTFRYVYVHLDLCSLSERHRLHLVALKAVKPQPTDAELLAALAACERHPNVEVTLNMISGLPFFTEADVQHSQRMLERILKDHAKFRGIHWGRLHAQPGAPLTFDYQHFEMAPSAVTFEDYYQHSLTNLREHEVYPDPGTLSYPFVYYTDQHLNSLVSKHYADVSQLLHHDLDQERRPVRYRRSVVSYAELEAWANGLAAQLRELGVGPEVRVGLCLERSAEMIAGMLAVLKAGGAYVPLDPQLPRERLAYLLEDAGPSVVLTRDAYRAQLGDYAGPVIGLDGPRAAAAPLQSDVAAANTAYIIYTSGSTGQPKGVLVPHANICNLVQSQIRSFDLHAGTRVLQFASLNFDASVSEIFTTLASGGELYLVRTDEQLIGETLAAVLRELDIAVVTLPPSLLQVMDGAQLPALQTVISAGEACPWDVVARWGAERRLLNFYGPTEATVGATYALVEAARPQTATVPIGRPIENVQVYVVDADLRPVPVGVPGELIIGGAGVARGYLHRAGQTAAQFVPAPRGAAPGARWYRTGDRVRYLEDGRLEYLGRLDQQVKIRGFRIEPGEVEAFLSQHPAVVDVAVVAQERRPGDVRLVAYFVPGTPAPSVTALRDFLRDYVPHYMIPGVFISLEALPLTPNGKIDRAALPSPDESMLRATEACVPPRNEVETILAAIWRQVLRIEQVGIHDNFFDLGGDSIQSIQIAAAAKKAGLHLTTQQIFQHPTIAGLSGVVGAAPRITAEQGLVTGPVPLTPIQHWFFEQPEAALPHWNQAILLETPAPFDPPLLQKTVAILLAHHDALRLRFRRGEAGWEQSNAAWDDAVPLKVVQLAGLSGAALREAIEAETLHAQTSFDLQHGPVLRFVYFDLGPAAPGRLFVGLHHLVVDALSWGILMDDLLTVYRQLERGESPALPAKTTAFQQWARRLVEYAQSDALLAEAAYWLAQAPEADGAIPVDFAAEPEDNVEARARTFSAELTPEETQALIHEVPTLYNTRMDEALLTALLAAFRDWTGAGELWLDLEGHGRESLFEDCDLSRTVGWFTSVYPVRLRAAADDSAIEILKRVKEQLRAIPHRGIGYGLLRYLSGASGAVAQVRALPPAQISYNYLGELPTGDLAVAAESAGPAKSSHALRRHLIEINIQIVAGSLRLDWTYSEALHRAETVERLAERTCAALRALIAHTHTPDAGGYTPSDFEEADLTQEELDWLMDKMADLI